MEARWNGEGEGGGEVVDGCWLVSGVGKCMVQCTGEDRPWQADSEWTTNDVAY